MADKEVYECENCGKKEELSESGSECCGKPMKKHEPLPVCETSMSAEDSRMDNLGEPCDDGRGGS